LNPFSTRKEEQRRGPTLGPSLGSRPDHEELQQHQILLAHLPWAYWEALQLWSLENIPGTPTRWN